MKYQAYAEYKDSGVEMLGHVPSHWNTKQVRFLLKDGADGIKIGPFGSALKLEDMIDSGIRVYGQENVIQKDFTLGKRMISHYKFSEMRVYQIYANDLLITMMGTSGKCELVPDDIELGIIDSHLLRLRVKESEILPRFFRLLIDECYEIENQIKISGKGSIMHGLNSSIVKALQLPLPSYDEQEKILAFLDHETAKIDTLIEKQQQLIKLLKEKRQAVISHAVTKGLNPNAPMKDSGVEWLGEVPEHWDVNNINYVLNAIGDVDHYMPQSVEKGIPYVMTGDLKELASSINFENCKQVSHEDYMKLSQKIKSSRGDLIVARYATIGTASYVDVDADFLVSYSCVTIKPNLSKVFGLYLFYYFKSNAFLQGIQNEINTNTQGNVGVNDLKKVKIALPTLAEQSKIVEYLQSKISKLDSISDSSKTAIDLMQERRTALISAAVTGKIDVRHWQGESA